MPDRADTLTLREVADVLGVHYMTVYGYVRTGRLDAHRDGVQWRVSTHAIEALTKPRPASTPPGSRASSSRLAERLLHGDEPGAWRIVEESLVGGREPEAVHLEVVGPALASIGRRWSRGSVGIAEEHRATVVAQRIVARLGPRFARRGRSRGTVVLGCVSGERHALPSAILADLLRGRGFEVADLGADTPPDSFVETALGAGRLVVVVAGAIGPGFETALAAAMRALAESGVAAPRYVGGPGVRDLRAARAVGADGWTGRDARTAMRAVDSLAGARMIALREMARAKVRFGLLIGAIALLVFLILFQQTLRNGLITSFVGAVEHQSAPVLVFSTDARRTLQASSISPELEAAVQDVDGVRRAGRIGQSTFSVRADQRIQGAAVIGYERRALGAPEALVAGRYPSAPGEGVANESDASEGFDLGDTIRVAPGGFPIRIVGQAREINLQASPTVFVRYDTWQQAVAAANPDARTPPPNALGVEPQAGISDEELVRRINAVSTDLEALTRDEAAAKSPGVAQVSTSFLVIFLLYGMVIPLVIGLFFLIVTLQKARTLTLLRAIGARSTTLVRALFVQVVVVVGLGVALGTLLYVPVSFQRIGSIPLSFDVGAVVGWGVAILVLGVASSWFSARRILRIEPASALQGGSV